MRWEGLTPSEEVESASWIRERLHGWAQDVGSVIPEGFAAYARVFHPAWRAHMVEWRWSEVAAANGRTVHPEMQFHSIATPAPGRPAVGADWYGPREGTMSPAQLRALIPLLAAHTTTPERCRFCLWAGYGYLGGSTAYVTSTFWKEGGSPHPAPLPAPRPPMPPLPSRLVRLPAREYLLFTGPVAAAGASIHADQLGWDDGPNLWWPDDRAWCVASEIDFPYTYIGGSDALVEAILAHPVIEALPATVHDRITADGDTVNS